ncbi:glycosyltransferase [Streptococcus suis]|uniref:glycosyltransferase n=1 Tax=Streptococcus suis TaxID=1307 RepID=UPI000CF4C881|nr:glycosyltransferase [Streptococcus suis]
MKILILANNDGGLYKFRKELIENLLLKNEVFISLPYGKLVEKLVEKGCQFIDTPIDRRGINPFRDIATVFAYYKLLRQIKPDLVISYTIKPVIYGGVLARLLKLKYVAKIVKQAGVGQFIFMRSIIVYGDSTSGERVITKLTKPNPSDFYGDSKWQVEQKLNKLSDNTFKVVIIRPPMIYGKGSKGNYPKLSKLAQRTLIFP